MFLKYFREKIFMKKFQNFSTNQIAGFWNFEFRAEISFNIKRVISWFQTSKHFGAFSKTSTFDLNHPIRDKYNFTK